MCCACVQEPAADETYGTIAGAVRFGTALSAQLAEVEALRAARLLGTQAPRPTRSDSSICLQEALDATAAGQSRPARSAAPARPPCSGRRLAPALHAALHGLRAGR